MPKASSLVAIDLFCGAGGVTRGFRDAGIDVRLGVDSEARFSDTYEKNNPGSRFLSARIEAVTAREILPAIKLASSDKLVVSACAPCQPFSLQNKKSRNHGFGDSRGTLLFEAMRIVRELAECGRKADYIFLENVPGATKSMAWQNAKSFLFECGYAVAFGVVNAADYGVPQSRKRLITIARNQWEFIELPPPTHGPGRLPYVTVGESLAGLPSLSAGMNCDRTANHRARGLSQLNLRRISSVPKNGGSRNSFSDELVLACHKEFRGHRDVYGRMSADKPAPTITTRCVSITNGRFGHPFENRGITVREAARLQAFPDSYVFYGDSLDLEARMVGNAVPVRLASVFGEYFLHLSLGDGADAAERARVPPKG